MPFNSELGMTTFDPLSAYESGQPAAHVAAVAFERGQSQADKARQILKRNMAVEAMKIRAQELYSHMEQTPENQNLAQRQAFLENAPGIWGEETGLGAGISQLLRSDEADLVRQQASEALKKKGEDILKLRSEVAEGNMLLKAGELARKISSDTSEGQIDLLKLALQANTAEGKAKEAAAELERKKEALTTAEAGKNQREAERLLSTDRTLLDLRKRREDLQKKVDARSGGASPLSKLAGKVPGAASIGIGEEAFNQETQKLTLDLQELDARIAQREAKITSGLMGGKQPQSEKPKSAPSLKLEVGKRYRDAEGKTRVYKGTDANGKPIWEE